MFGDCLLGEGGFGSLLRMWLQAYLALVGMFRHAIKLVNTKKFFRCRVCAPKSDGRKFLHDVLKLSYRHIESISPVPTGQRVSNCI